MARLSLRRTKGPIVLLTDFGLKDGYVGVMKGVIRGICRSEVIDLSHEIAPQDVAEAAFVLASSYRYFPRETIFVAVVDPGVGTERAVLRLRANRQTFLAPDNGLLSIVAEEAGGVLRRVAVERYFLHGRSATFHGRDVFAPVAAHLAAGAPSSALGPRVKQMRKLELPAPIRGADGDLRGQVVYIDHFGDMVTNIRQASLARHLSARLGEVEVRVRRHVVRGVDRTYGDREPGALVALIGSSGYLELAVNQGSAAQLLGCAKGEAVVLSAPGRRAP